MPDRNTWEICTLAYEAPCLVLAWVAHHLALGADRIHLYLDAPNPVVTHALKGHPKLRLALCDDAFWAKHPAGQRPIRQGLRQSALLQQVVDTTDAGWVFHIDVDEFLFSETPIRDSLAALPAEKEHAAVMARERVHLGPSDPDNILSGVFRLQTFHRFLEQASAADGPAAPYLQRGMTAYCGGKTAFRAGCGLPVGVHGPKPPKPETGGSLPSIALLHFDGLTPGHWVNKRILLLMQQPNAAMHETEHRRRQLLQMQKLLDDPTALEEFYGILKHYDAERTFRLTEMGLLKRYPFDPRAALAAEFPALSVDLSAAAFDSYAII